MLNKVILMGRITHDLEIKNTKSGIAVLAFNIAIDRGYAKQGEEKQTDFIKCIAWKNHATFIEKYFKKGSMIAVEGRLQSRTYDDKNGIKHYVTEVIIEKVSFTGEPKKDNNGSSTFGSSKEMNQSTSNNIPTQENTDLIGDINDFEVVISDDGVPF